MFQVILAVYNNATALFLRIPSMAFLIPGFPVFFMTGSCIFTINKAFR